jgi:hypothetical protein
MKFQTELDYNKGLITVQTPSDFIKAIANLDAKENSFVILEDENGKNYIQCLGNVKGAVIEVRYYSSETEFKHYILEQNTTNDQTRVSLEHSSGTTDYPASQIFSIEETQDIFKAFYEGKNLLSLYRVFDMTDEFGSLNDQEFDFLIDE